MKPWKAIRLLLGLVGLAILACLASATVFAIRYHELTKDEDRVVLELQPDQADVTYCTTDGKILKMDLYFPADSSTSLRPVAIYLHGGGWVGGDKRKGSSLFDIPTMTSRGYVVAAVNYRLVRDGKFPASIIDVKCAIRFLRANAENYMLDTERFGIWGASAGGHLAALAGLVGPEAGWDQGEYLDQSSKVSIVADLFGPADLTAQDFNFFQRYLLYQAFGTVSPENPTLIQASPVNYISRGAPPVLIIHGEQDMTVPASQSKEFYRRLAAGGGEVKLVLVKNANHEFAPTGGVIQPTRDEISQILADFFDAHLK